MGYKIAAKLGSRYLDALTEHEASVARNVTANLFDRHIQPLFLPALTARRGTGRPDVMANQISRRGFVKASMLASAAIPLGLGAQGAADTSSNVPPAPVESFPKGKIAGQEFSRLMMGGNLIGGYSHSRDLNYVSTLMRRYNTPQKIRETLKLAEQQGINAINTWVMQENQALFDHWKAGGKMKWFSQVRPDAGGGFSQIQKAIDQGATGVHLTGDSCERLITEGKFERIAESVQLIKSQKRIAGVAAHDLCVIVACEKARLDVDFYQKTFHSHDYYTAPRADETAVWARMTIPGVSTRRRRWTSWPRPGRRGSPSRSLPPAPSTPRAAFPYAFNSGADFILVGMFDWQVEEDAKLAKHVLSVVMGANSKRTRPWV